MMKLLSPYFVSRFFQKSNPRDTIPIEIVFSEWLQWKKQTVRPSTYAHYSLLITAYLSPALDKFQIQDLNCEILENIFLFLQTQGRRQTSGGLSPQTIFEITTILQQILDFGAQKYGYSKIQVLQKRPIPLKTQKCLTPEQQIKLESGLDLSHLFDQGVLLSLYTGLRIGELCALQKKSIDFSRGSLTVSATLQRIQSVQGVSRTQVIIGPPKSRSSYREIPLSPKLLKVLQESSQTSPELFFLTGTTDFMEPRICQYKFEKLLKCCGLPHINFHMLRHTFATRCVEAGADIRSLSEILGHQTVQITLDRYVHPSLEQKRKTVQLISQ